MSVVIYEAELLIAGVRWPNFVVSDGEGPDIIFGSATVAGAAAYALGVRKGISIDAEQAAMWMRHRTRRRIFRQMYELSYLEAGLMTTAFQEVDPQTGSTLNNTEIHVAMDAEGNVVLPPERSAPAIVGAVQAAVGENGKATRTPR